MNTRAEAVVDDDSDLEIDLTAELEVEVEGEEAEPGAAEDRGDEVTPAEPEPKAKDEPEPAPQGKGDKPMPTMIPHTRFAEVNNSLKEQRELNGRLLAALTANGKAGAPEAPAAETPAPLDLKALEREYTNAMMEGDIDKAVDLRSTIDDERQNRAVQRTLEHQRGEQAAALFAQEVDTLRAEYPDLDHENPDANQDAIDRVVKARGRLVALEGLPEHIALREAVAHVAERLGLKKKGETAGIGDPAPRTNPRVEEGRRRNVAANNAQPPPMDGGMGERGGRAQQMNVEKMTDAQFAALPEAEKKRLRGD